MLVKILKKLKNAKPHPPSRFRDIPRRSVNCCPICDSGDYQFLFSAWTSPDTVSTKLCKNCGLVYASETLDEDNLEGHGKHGGSLVFGKKNTEKVMKKGFELMYQRGQKYFDYISQYVDVEGKSHLDITCQYGGVVKYFQEQGLDSYGIDNEQDVIDYGINKKELHLIYGDFLKYQFGKKFDIITMPRVLNHYLNPTEYLKKVTTILNDDGVLFIEQLDFAHAIRRKGMYRAISLDHPVMYTFDTLKYNLSQANLQVVKYSNDIEPNFTFNSLNHLHALCKFSPMAPDNKSNAQDVLNQILISSQQFVLTNKFNVYK